MCTEPLYALRLKDEYDKKFQRFKKHTPIKVVGSVRDIGTDFSKIDYNPKYYDVIMISCGQCLQCRLLRVKQRSVMCMCESLEHKENSFVTLTFGYPQTYSYYRHTKGLSHYISSKKAHFHEWSLDTETFTKFMKRLRNWYYYYQLGLYLISIGRSDLVKHSLLSVTHIRINSLERPFLLKNFNPKKIRFMHCGEYGSLKQRSHHHVILFGFQFPDLKPIYEDGKKYFTSEILSNLWPFGIHRIGECTYNSCAYVARYVTKKITGNNQDEYYNGRKPEYITYSTKPVLGAEYFIRNYKEIATTQQLKVVTDKKYSCSMPKSYDNILKKIDKDLFYHMKNERLTNFKTNFEKLLKSKRSIYDKLDSNQKISLSILKKLVRSYEEGSTISYNEYLQKAKAFGVSVKFFVSEFSENAVKYLSNKNFKSHKSRNTNDLLHEKYTKFEQARKKHINSCYNVNDSDQKIMRKLKFYIEMPNPFKVSRRGRCLLDIESLDLDSGIDEKGEEYV